MSLRVLVQISRIHPSYDRRRLLPVPLVQRPAWDMLSEIPPHALQHVPAPVRGNRSFAPSSLIVQSNRLLRHKGLPEPSTNELRDDCLRASPC